MMKIIFLFVTMYSSTKIVNSVNKPERKLELAEDINE